MRKRKIRDHVIDPTNPDDPMEWVIVLDRARIPARYRPAAATAISDAKTRAQVDGLLCQAKEWLGVGAGWYVNGPLNTGKSSIASILLKDALARAERGLWLAARDIPNIFFNDTDDNRTTIAAISEADIVVLDDLGAVQHALGGAVGNVIEKLVRIVYDNERPLVVTSNLGWGQFKNNFGVMNESLVSVLGRATQPVEITNTQWPASPTLGDAARA